MRSERDKMLAGELYDPMDPELVTGRDRARDLCQALNATREAQREERRRILKELFGAGGESVWMQPPFFCDYGSNILLGERVFFNFNCVVLDVCEVRIGDFTLFGPAVQVYTATHPMNAELRRKQEFARPIDDRLRRLGRRRSDPLPRRSHRLEVGHRGRKRGHAGHSRGGLRRRQPLPGHPRDHRIVEGWPIGEISALDLQPGTLGRRWSASAARPADTLTGARRCLDSPSPTNLNPRPAPGRVACLHLRHRSASRSGLARRVIRGRCARRMRTSSSWPGSPRRCR